MSILTSQTHRVRLGLAVALLVILSGLGTLILPSVIRSIALLRAQDDPAQLAELRLPAAATKNRINSEIEDALRQGDGDLVASFLELADAHGVEVDPASCSSALQGARPRSSRVLSSAC